MDGWNNAEDQQQAPQGFEFEAERFFDSFIRVAKLMLLKPREFFRQLPAGPQLTSPMIFLAFCSFITALLVANAWSGGVQLFVILCCANILSAIIYSMILHVLVKKLYRSQARFGSTLRVLAYASLIDMVSWIFPILLLYKLYLVFIGIQEQHRITPQKAALSIIIIICILVALFLSIALLSPESLQESQKMLDPGQTEPGF